MTGKRVGYVRVSSIGQNESRQLEGVETDKRFVDKVSGRSTDRPQLKAMLDYVREGDRVIVHSMDRLARNLPDLLNLVKTLTSQDVVVEFMKESLIFSGDDSHMSNLLLSIMGAVAEFEIKLSEDRQQEGIALAKKRGVYKGRKLALNKQQVIEIKERIAKGHMKTHIANDFGVCTETLYKHLRA